MTMNRPRLIAIILCGLIVLAFGYLLVSATAPSRYRAVPHPAALEVRNLDVADPPPAMPRLAFEPAEAPSASTAAGPNVGPTAAPGVAFNYRYAFRLAAQRIAAVQEGHAQMCERLTLARCRITGMSYRVVDDRNVEAMLAINLDPGIARLFGREGVAAVVRAEGMLTESEIGGTEVGSAIRAAGRSLAELEAALARIESQLARRRLTDADRIELDSQAQQLRTQIRALRESRDQQQDSLATTPMTFRYGSGDLVPGFAQRPTLRQAMQRAADNFADGATLLLIVLVTLLPWAAVAALGWLLFRLMRRQWFAGVARVETRARGMFMPGL